MVLEGCAAEVLRETASKVLVASNLCQCKICGAKLVLDPKVGSRQMSCVSPNLPFADANRGRSIGNGIQFPVEAQLFCDRKKSKSPRGAATASGKLWFTRAEGHGALRVRVVFE